MTLPLQEVTPVSILDALPLPAWCSDASGRVTFVNAALRALAGVNATEMPDPGVLIHPEDRAALVALAASVSTKGECSATLRLCRADGTDVAMLVVLRPLPGSDGGWMATAMTAAMPVPDRPAPDLDDLMGQLSALMDASPVGFALLDRDLRYSYVNTALAFMNRRAPETHLGRHVREVLRGAPEELFGVFEQARETFEPVLDFPVSIMAPSGATFHWRVNVYPIGTDGIVTSLGIVVREVSDRVRAEQELRASEERFRLLAENASDLISRHGPDGAFLWASPSYRTIVGFEPEELIGRNAFEIFPEESLPMILEHFQGLLEGKPPRILTYRGKRRDGSPLWLESATRVLRDAAGNLAELHAISRDVTDRVEAELRVRHSEERLRALIGAIAQTVWTTDASGLVVEDLADWRTFTGQTVEEVRGTGWLDAIHPDDRAPAMRVWMEAVRAKGPLVNEYRVRRADGEYRTMHARGIPLLNADGEVREWIGVNIDITERVRAEEAVRELNATLEERVRERTAELRQSEEALRRSNAELEQFAYVASHDLQEPLRTVTSYADLLELRYGGALDDRGRGIIETIRKGTTRMKRLIDDLLAFSRLQAPQGVLPVTSSARALQDALDGLSVGLAERNARVDVTTLPDVRSDAGLLAQVFQNLVGNALKFSRAGVPPVVRVSATPEGEFVRFTVRDNGIGIAPANAERVFLIFQRLHHRSEFEGNGLGLAICRKIVEWHGGRIWVESVPGEGSAFHFTLPAASDS